MARPLVIEPKPLNNTRVELARAAEIDATLRVNTPGEAEASSPPLELHRPRGCRHLRLIGRAGHGRLRRLFWHSRCLLPDRLSRTPWGVSRRRRCRARQRGRRRQAAWRTIHAQHPRRRAVRRSHCWPPWRRNVLRLRRAARRFRQVHAGVAVAPQVLFLSRAKHLRCARHGRCKRRRSGSGRTGPCCCPSLPSV